MSELQFKTRGNCDPKGKPKVFFASCPTDFALFFSSLSDEILESSDCSIWYLDQMDDAADERDFSFLDQMQLLVIPITAQLLRTENVVRTTILPYAAEKHIPLLPIMVERGVENDFNRICGDYQLLDRNEADVTTLGYKEKLKIFLASVLIGDELARKVRAAFRAYIFLSYRKKDRKHAQELMHLIHENDFCRDVAIWYDEFLVPGEHFNQAIRDAIEKSSLFALVVTPNLINEPNYIISTEYPLVQSFGKPVLAVEMVSTDADKMRDTFPELPVPTLKASAAALRKLLWDNISHIAHSADENDPAHSYFIGLAYLNGIDVEVDYPRAMRLIEHAANSGLPEAMKELVNVYRLGRGVKRNYRAAIQWQEKYVQYLREQYQGTKSFLDCSQLIDALWYLGDYYSEMYSYDQAQTVWNEVLSLSEKWEEESIQKLNYNSLICQKLGDICREKGQLDKASAFYRRKLDTNRLMQKKKPTDQRFKHDTAVSLERLGDIATDQREYSAALEYYTQCQEMRRELVEADGKNAVYRQHLAAILDRIGDVYTEISDYQNAGDSYKASLELSEQAYQEHDDYETNRNLGLSYARLGSLAKKQEQYQNAIEWYLKSLPHREKCCELSDNYIAKRELSVLYMYLGECFRETGEYASAYQYCSQAKEIREEILKISDAPSALRDMALLYDFIGELIISRYESDERVSLSEALDAFRHSEQFARRILQSTQTVRAFRDLLVVLVSQAKVQKLLQDDISAKELYMQALSIGLEIREKFPQAQILGEISHIYYHLGTIEKELKNYESSLAHFQELVSFRKAEAAAGKTSGAMRSLALAYDEVAGVLRILWRFDEAKQYCQQACEIYTELANRKQSLLALDDLAVCYYMLYQLADAEERIQHLKTARKIREKIESSYPENRRNQRILAHINQILRDYP